jgi:hypothetical protein
MPKKASVVQRLFEQAPALRTLLLGAVAIHDAIEALPITPDERARLRRSAFYGFADRPGLGLAVGTAFADVKFPGDHEYVPDPDFEPAARLVLGVLEHGAAALPPQLRLREDRSS